MYSGGKVVVLGGATEVVVVDVVVVVDAAPAVDAPGIAEDELEDEE